MGLTKKETTTDILGDDSMLTEREIEFRTQCIKQGLLADPIKLKIERGRIKDAKTLLTEIESAGITDCAVSIFLQNLLVMKQGA